MRDLRRWSVLGILALATMSAGVSAVSADCPDGTTGDDIIVCDTSPPPPQGIYGNIGNDSITVTAGTTVSGIEGDKANSGTPGNGAAGDDTIINNGIVTGNIIGDDTTGLDAGNDTIINNGDIGGSIYGDAQGPGPFGKGGADTIINNGHIAGGIQGENSPYGQPGGDTIINNGVIDGSIYGDSNVGIRDSNIIVEGDIIINNGVVGGDIVGGDGNDEITVVVGSSVGGTISGGIDLDTLIFSGNTSDEAGYNQVQAMVGCNPCAGTVTLDGHSYTFNTFEELRNLLVLIVNSTPGGPVSVGIQLVEQKPSEPSRINQGENAAPFALYCNADSISIVDIGANGQGGAEFNFTFDVLPSVGNEPIQLATSAGNQLYLMPDGTLLAVGPSLDGTKTYSLSFTTDCKRNGVGTEA